MGAHTCLWVPYTVPRSWSHDNVASTSTWQCAPHHRGPTLQWSTATWHSTSHGHMAFHVNVDPTNAVPLNSTSGSPRPRGDRPRPLGCAPGELGQPMRTRAGPAHARVWGWDRPRPLGCARLRWAGPCARVRAGMGGRWAVAVAAELGPTHARAGTERGRSNLQPR